MIWLRSKFFDFFTVYVCFFSGFPRRNVRFFFRPRAASNTNNRTKPAFFYFFFFFYEVFIPYNLIEDFFYFFISPLSQSYSKPQSEIPSGRFRRVYLYVLYYYRYYDYCTPRRNSVSAGRKGGGNKKRIPTEIVLCVIYLYREKKNIYIYTYTSRRNHLSTTAPGKLICWICYFRFHFLPSTTPSPLPSIRSRVFGRR